MLFLIRVALGFILFSSQALAASDFGGSPLMVKTYVQIPGYDVQIKSQETGRQVKYNPNLSALTGFQISYAGLISAGYGFRNPVNEKDRIAKGNTEYEDWRFSLAYDHFHVSLGYQQYTGFYIANTSSVDNTWVAGSPLIQLPDMKLQSGSVNFTYIWSPEDYSLVAALDQTSRQEKSGGSLLLGGAVVQTNFSNSAAIIPSQVRTEYGADQNIEEGRFTAITVKFGYGYTLAWSKTWFTSVAFQAGGGQQKRDYRDATTSHSSWNVAGKFDAMLSLGYNGDVWLSGLKFSGEATSFKTASTEISAGMWAANLFLGRHF